MTSFRLYLLPIMMKTISLTLCLLSPLSSFPEVSDHQQVGFLPPAILKSLGEVQEFKGRSYF